MVNGDYPRLTKIWADGPVYGLGCSMGLPKTLGSCLEVVLRSDDVSGFAVLPRALGGRAHVRLVGPLQASGKRTRELCPEHSESMIYVAMTQMLLKGSLK